MSKVHYFLDSIELAPVQELIDKLETLDGNIDLFFETDGGLTDVMDYLVHYLNKRKKDITIYLIGELASAGTKLLTDYKGKIILHEGLDLIMFHKWDRKIYTLRKSNFIDNSILIKYTEELNVKFAKKLKKLGLTDEHLKMYSDGKDVVLYKKDFNQLNINND